MDYGEGPNTNQSHTNDAFADFSPPETSTPAVPPGSTTESFGIERLPDLSSRIPGAGHGIPQVEYLKTLFNIVEAPLIFFFEL